MEQPSRTCTGKCKKYRVKKPPVGSRYGAGHARCQICDVWIDHRGGHLKDGSPAEAESSGWFCNCCNYKVRRSPRNIEYKAKIRTAVQGSGQARRGRIDLEYFNKRRARMLRGIGEALALSRISDDPPEQLLPAGMSADEIAAEFETSMADLLALAESDSANKVSLIAELERCRYKMRLLPTKEEMAANSKFTMAQYEAEFQSWEHLLDRLDYDPWYRDRMSTAVPMFGMVDELRPDESKLERKNRLIAEALGMLREGKLRSSQIRDRLGITGYEMAHLESRLARIDGVSRTKGRGGGPADPVFAYKAR